MNRALPRSPMLLIAAGGTGGHLFPAQALAEELIKRGWRIELATDHRVSAYGQDFPASAVHLISSATPSGGGAIGKLSALLKLAIGTLSSLSLISRIKPTVAIGFGGYPTVPPILAASMKHVPTIVHDANAVLGRANRFLATRVSAIATSSPEARAPKSRAKVTLTGNPVRPTVLTAAQTPYPWRKAEEPFHLLVFGGSQGAHIFSELVPAALSNLDAAHRSRIRLTQQSRPEDLGTARGKLSSLGLQADLAPFFKDLPARIAQSHLVISRSGAGTVTELSVIGRPALLVPLPGAIDQDQKANGAALAHAGGAYLFDQRELTPERLAKEIAELMDNPETLNEAARKAKAFGRPDAVGRLADLVEQVAANANAKQT